MCLRCGVVAQQGRGLALEEGTPPQPSAQPQEDHRIIGLPGQASAQAARNLLPFFTLIAAWIAILWSLPWWIMHRQFLIQPGARGPRSLTLDGAGRTGVNDRSSDVEWKNYVGSVEGKNQILLYTSPARFNILSKRAIADVQIGDVRELLKQNIQPNCLR